MKETESGLYRLKFLVLFLLYIPGCYGQDTQISSSCDCEKSYKLTLYDSLQLKVKAPTCAGKKDISFLANNYTLINEHNSAWFIIDIKKCGNLTFTIIPSRKESDFNFMVFTDTNNFCDLVAKGKVLPVRTNTASSKVNKGSTGLDLRSLKVYSEKNSEPSFSRKLNVAENEKIIIMVDNVNKDSDFDLILKINEIESFKIFSYAPGSKAALPEVNYNFLTKNDELLYAILNANYGEMNYKFIKKHAQLPLPNSDKFKYDVNDFSNIRITKKGYLSAVITDMERPCKEIYIVKLEKLIKGKSYFYKGIYINNDLNIDLEKSKYFIKALKYTIDNNRIFNFTITNFITEKELTESQKMMIGAQLINILDCGPKLKVKIIANIPEPEVDSGIILRVE